MEQSFSGMATIVLRPQNGSIGAGPDAPEQELRRAASTRSFRAPVRRLPDSAYCARLAYSLHGRTIAHPRSADRPIRDAGAGSRVGTRLDRRAGAGHLDQTVSGG